MIEDDDLVAGDTEFPLGRAVQGVAQLLRPKVDVCVEQRGLFAAMSRLVEAQARREEVHAAREERALVGELPVPLLSRLPGRFDLVVVGDKGSGKTRAVEQLAELYLSAAREEWHLPGLPPKVVHTVACWPEWSSVRRCLLVVDEAGVLMESNDGEIPAPLARVMSLARHLEVSIALVAQHSSQIPPAIFRQGVGMLVTGTPWSWRAFGRKEVITRLDAAQDVISRGREIDERTVAYVDAAGFVRPVVVVA